MVARIRIAIGSMVLMLALGNSFAFAGIYSDWYDNVAGSQYPSPAAAVDAIQLKYDNNTTNNSGQSKTYGNNNIAGGIGGEFRVVNSGQSLTYSLPENPSASWVFKTFCIERAEHFDPSKTYRVTIDQFAAYGDNGGIDGTLPGGKTSDSLSHQSKLLYGYYFTGLLDDVLTDFDYQTEVGADALQLAFWAIEDTLNLNSVSNSYSQARELAKLLKAFAEDTYDDGVTFFDDRVVVMNLWEQLPDNASNYDFKFGGKKYKRAQSQLAYVPDSTGNIPVPTPEPASLAVWGGLSLVGLAWTRRKQRKIAAA